MTEIKITLDKSRYADEISALGLGMDAKTFVMEASVQGEVVGYSIFRADMTAGRVWVHAVHAPGDDWLYDALVRAVINISLNMGCETGSFENPADGEMLEKLYFSRLGLAYEPGQPFAMEQILNNCKNCKNV